MNGMLAAGEAEPSNLVARGMDMGTFGFEVAAVGKGGSSRSSGVRPGMRSVTTFWIR
jgi:hypothetical protein